MMDQHDAERIFGQVWPVDEQPRHVADPPPWVAMVQAEIDRQTELRWQQQRQRRRAALYACGLAGLPWAILFGLAAVVLGLVAWP